eukprot:NODE_111_length_18624_cov_1.285020.p14 type:complete len:147 gc:universal NODE_111_length_18624_cov_1.285020:5108-4668(-)
MSMMNLSISSRVASILDELGVEFNDTMMSELVKDISVDSRVELLKEDEDGRKEELLKYIEEVPPFLMIDYQLTRQAVHIQTHQEPKPSTIASKPTTRKPHPLSQYRSFINDPVERIHYYKDIWAKDKVVTSMGKVLKDDYKILYKK